MGGWEVVAYRSADRAPDIGASNGNAGAARDPAIRLLLPTGDVESPEVTILIPAVNEELTIADFVAWCHEGLRDADAVGEILIVDSSSDRTAELALAGGARVLKTPKRGLGRAYIDALPYVRGATREALDHMGLVSQSWEYASEMVLKSVRMELRTTEVPVTFYKDRDGRLSHHKRSGWFSPFHAAWINLRAMFIHGAQFFLFKPGIALFTLGLLLTLPLSFGGITIGPLTFNLYWMLIGLTLSVLGLQSIYFGCLADVLLDYTGRARQRWRRVFRYTSTVVASGLLFTLGFGLAASV